MIKIRRSEERGDANHGWLNSKHTFSFGDYIDEKFMGFRDLRVINEDRIVGGSGFAEHGHRDMEIISYVIDGALEHRDSMGNSTIIKPYEVQRMSAGKGVRHSEFNHFKDKETHFLQIWILPTKNGLEPGYGQKSFENELKTQSLTLVVSENGRDGSISMNQSVDLYIGNLSGGSLEALTLRYGGYGWIQLIEGDLEVGVDNLKSGDALSVSNEKSLSMKTQNGAHYLFFDLK